MQCICRPMYYWYLYTLAIRKQLYSKKGQKEQTVALRCWANVGSTPKQRWLSVRCGGVPKDLSSYSDWRPSRKMWRGFRLFSWQIVAHLRANNLPLLPAGPRSGAPPNQLDLCETAHCRTTGHGCRSQWAWWVCPLVDNVHQRADSERAATSSCHNWFLPGRRHFSRVYTYCNSVSNMCGVSE